MELVNYLERVMSQIELKLWEFQITCKNAVFLPKMKLVRFFVLVLIQSNSQHQHMSLHESKQPKAPQTLGFKKSSQK